MEVFKESASLRKYLQEHRTQSREISLVPTMGNLHRGHLSLIEIANHSADVSLASIFVNPLQFGPDEDLDAYPRTLDSDLEQLEGHGCNCVFVPSVNEIYGSSMSAQTLVSVPGISEKYCGASRPGHFDGVATVVTKLFNITQPNKAVFGLKDYQQFLVIRKLVEDLKLPIEILGGEIVREASGLAMSSRNNYLDDAEKETASSLNKVLQQSVQSIKNGNADYRQLEAEAIENLKSAGIRPDYFGICHATTLAPATSIDKSLAILAAGFMGKTRLIDNVRFETDVPS